MSLNYETLVNDLLSALQQQDEDAISTQARFILSLEYFEWSRLPLEEIMSALSAGLAEEECSKLLVKVLSQPEYQGVCDSHGHLIRQGLQSESIALVRLSMQIINFSPDLIPAVCKNGVLEAYLMLLNHESLAIVEECSTTIKQYQLEKYLIPLDIEPLRKVNILLNGHLREGWELGARLYRERRNDELDQAALLTMFEEATEGISDVQMAYDVGILHEVTQECNDQLWSYFTKIGMLRTAGEIMTSVGLFEKLRAAISPAAYIARGAWAYEDQTLLRELEQDCFSHSSVDLGLGAAKGLSLAAEAGTLSLDTKRVALLAMAESKTSEEIRKQLAFELLSNLLKHEAVVAELASIVLPFLLDRQSDESLIAAHWRFDILTRLSNESSHILGEQQMQQVARYIHEGVVSKGTRVMIGQLGQ